MLALGAIGPALFLDCGANFGYWSARVETGEFGAHEVVAVEASESTCSLLERNLGGRGRVIHAAVSDQVGEVSFDDSQPHQARQISAVGMVTVPATTIDCLVGQATRVLVKLDVEGAEPAALQGAAKTLARADVAILYEDHGSDADCRATQAMLKADLPIYEVTGSGIVCQLAGVRDVRQRKTNPSVGYNYVAVTPRGAYDRLLRESAT